jgi:hypothetical protein
MSTSQSPGAPHATANPPPVPTTNANFSRPTTANASAQDTINSVPPPDTTNPASPPNVHTTSPSTAPPTVAQPSTTNPASEEHETLNDKLNAADRYWKFKFALTLVLLITGFIGIGCFAWLMSSDRNQDNFYSGYGLGYYGYYTVWPSFITWSISIIWCVVCILCFVARKRAVHPGVRVTMDLLLWLGFIVTALFATSALYEILDWGRDGDLGYGYSYSGSSSSGDYVLENNNTWVWEQDSSYINIPRDCNGTSYSYEQAMFKDCAEQDAYVNQLWHQKGHLANVMLTGVVCQFLGLLFHFALFVWACVDTNRYNRTKVSKDAEKLAAGIVQTMIQNGAVMPPPGQAYLRPQMGYYQLPPQHQQMGYAPQQAYPMANMHPTMRMPMQQNQAMTPGQFHPNGPAPGPTTAGPSNEKSQPRYA